jgi:hypothetical protein
MMILTQKLTLLAFSCYDGCQSEENLNPDQKFQLIKYKNNLKFELIIKKIYLNIEKHQHF